MCVKMEEEKPNVERLGALSVGCQLVHQIPNDTAPIHYILLGVCKKQSGGEGKNDVIGFLRAKDRH